MNIQLPKVQVPEFPEKKVSIEEFGAVSDGVTMNTKAINAAILSVSEAGGGTVVIPAGYWKTATIELKDNVHLHTEQGAFIKFSGDWRDYPLIHSHFEGFPTARCISPIYANGAENIAITGNGVFDGAGENWRVCKKWKFTAPQWEELKQKPGVYYEEKGENSLVYPSKASYEGNKYNNAHGGMVDNLEEAEAYRIFFRPVMVNLVGCKRVYLEGITFQNSPAWCLHPRMCDDILMEKVSMRNPWYAQNGDALDLESCHNVEIRGCIFDAGDDGICIKSGKNKPGRNTERATENVWIHDCIVYHGHGGFVVGSEMSCGVKNILVENCTFTGTDVGLRFKSCLGRGGAVENLLIRNIRMDNIKEHAIVMNMGYSSAIGSEKDIEKQYPEEDIPEFCNIHMEDILCIGAKRGIEISGLMKKPIHNITIKDSFIQAKEGVRCQLCKDIRLENVTIATDGKEQLFAKENISGEYQSEF